MVIEVESLTKCFQRPRRSARLVDRMNPFVKSIENMVALENLDLSVARALEGPVRTFISNWFCLWRHGRTFQFGKLA